MFKIGEFSKLTQVSIRMLRYYDEIGLLKPAQIDKMTGYRMYHADQIPSLQRIILLKEFKFSTSEIKEALQYWNDKTISQLLQQKKMQIKKEIDEQFNRIEKINIALKDIEQNKIDYSCNVDIKKIPSMKILSIREKLLTYFDEYILWRKLYNFVKQNNIQIKSGLYNNIAIYHDIDHKDKDVDVEVGVVVNKLGKNECGFIYRETDEVEKMAYTMVKGSYANLANAYKSLAYWIEEHNESLLEAPSQQICHVGAEDTQDESKYLTEIQIPLK